ncbi:MAG: hypothetical protein E7090_09060 [Bacteroidales bacterium]|nr:hypothetical protein [Bacteroidales bacterium]
MKKITLYIMLLSVFLVAACNEDADFSSDPSLRLEFSCDTLSFDTIFTSVGTPTAVMKVYNRNGSSLNISNVRLKNGEKSGFRINVDGQYGNDIQGLEIRKNDSLYVFVEATLERHGQSAPLMVSDSLQFMLESGVEQNVTLLAYGRDVELLRGAVFGADATLAKGGYLVYDSLHVAPGATLTIEPGSVLYFHKDAEVKISGTLIAHGTKEHPIVFRGDRTDNMFDYLPYDRIPGQWGGITFAPESNGNSLVYCDVHSAKYGIRVQAGSTDEQRLSILSSRLENFDGNALETVMSRVDVANSLIANARGNCVKIIGGSVRFIHCTIANFYVWKQRDVALALHNSIDGAPAPLGEALFANCIITGSKEDELMGYLSEFGDTIPNCINYKFVSSLINTVQEENENFINIIYDDKEEHPFAKEHFALIDHDVFAYDFHLTDSTSARGISSSDYSVLYPYDIDGVERLPNAADAGCFQYVDAPDEE